jgi:hypothetical protein
MLPIYTKIKNKTLDSQIRLIYSLRIIAKIVTVVIVVIVVYLHAIPNSLLSQGLSCVWKTTYFNFVEKCRPL